MHIEIPNHYEELIRRQRADSNQRPPRPSAAVVPWRHGPGGEVEVYWVRRSPTMKFLGGWYAFPGGGLARSDVAVPIEQAPRGASETSFSDPEPEIDAEQRQLLGPDLAPGLVACAVRELFEETGLLLEHGLAHRPAEANPEAICEPIRKISLTGNGPS